MRNHLVYLLLSLIGHAVVLEAADQKSPLLFPPAQNGLGLDIPQFFYELDESAESLELGAIQVNQLALRPRMVLSNNGKQNLVALKWDDDVFDDPYFFLLFRDGSTVALGAFLELTQGFQTSESDNYPESLWSGLEGFQYAKIFSTADVTRLFRDDEAFQVCASPGGASKHHRFCSPHFRLGDSTVRFEAASEKPSAPSVFVNGEPMPLRSVVPLDDSTLQVRIDFAKGSHYKFEILKPHFVPVDIYQDADNSRVVLTGYGERPVFDKKTPANLPVSEDFLENIFLFDYPSTWSVSFSEMLSFIYVPSPTGGFVRYPLFSKQVPTESLRIYAARPQPLGTYSDMIEVILSSDSALVLKVEAAQNVREEGSAEAKVWSLMLQIPEGEEIIRVPVKLLSNENNELEAELAVYKSRAYEFIAMLGAAATSEDLAFAGDVRASAWLEDLAGCRHKLLCHQRWGTSARYFLFDSKNETTSGNNGRVSVRSYQWDFMYRFTPGVWGHNEMWAGTSSFQHITFNTLESSRWGLGFSWARSLPVIFEPLFNLLPFMDYSKWVHMEFVYYPLSMSEDISFEGHTNWSLNFQGRVNWRPWLFGEVGFGASRTSFEQIQTEAMVDSTNVFGTLGLGFRF